MEKAALKGMFASGQMPVGTEYKTALTGILQAFPYFQLAQVLLAKQMYDTHEPEASMRIKLASVYAPDRKVMYHLFKLANAPTEIQQSIQPDQKSQASATGKEGIKYNFVYSSTTVKKPGTVQAPPVAETLKDLRQTETFIQKESESKLRTTNIPPKPVNTATPEEKQKQEIKKTEPVSPTLVKKVTAPLPIEKKMEKSSVPIKYVPEIEKTGTNKKPEEKNIIPLKPQVTQQPAIKSEIVPIEIKKAESPPDNQAALQPTAIEPLPENQLKYSFGAWLKALPEISVEKKKLENAVNQKGKSDIINTFLENLPTISRPKAEFFSPVKAAKLSITEDDEIVSETLAGIYLEQGSLHKALKSYETLLGQFPEKKNIFAPRIEEIRALIRENTKK